MPEQTDNRLRWERVPILGNNPVFCFEARRVWTRRTVLVLFLLVIGIGFVGWAARKALWEGWQSGSGVVVRSLLTLLGGALPPRVPRIDHLVEPSSSGPLLWHLDTPHVLWQTLEWTVLVAGTYVVPALVALSFAGDRAAGRLEPLLASRVSLRGILIGKLMAPVLPFVVLLLAGAVVCTFPSVNNAIGRPGPTLWRVVFDALRLLVAALIGLRVGASARRPSVAVGVSLLLVLVGVPLLWQGIAAVAVLPLRQAISSPLGPPWFGMYISSLTVAVYVLILAVLWLTTERALARIAE